VTFEKARSGVTTLHLSRVAHVSNVITLFWPLGLEFENNPLKGDYFFQALTKLPTHLLRRSSESQANQANQEKTASILFSRTAHLLDTYSILCTSIAHFPGGVDFAPVQF
jgi:hypothetical protein